MTQAQLTRFCTFSTQPWREYCPWKPDDMPPKRGNPERLAKLLAELGADEEDEDELPGTGSNASLG